MDGALSGPCRLVLAQTGVGVVSERRQRAHSTSYVTAMA
jgi:hypothetical protein